MIHYLSKFAKQAAWKSWSTGSTAWALLQNLLSPALLKATIASFVNVIDTQKKGQVSLRPAVPLEYCHSRAAKSLLVLTRCRTFHQC